MLSPRSNTRNECPSQAVAAFLHLTSSHHFGVPTLPMFEVVGGAPLYDLRDPGYGPCDSSEVCSW